MEMFEKKRRNLKEFIDINVESEVESLVKPIKELYEKQENKITLLHLKNLLTENNYDDNELNLENLIMIIFNSQNFFDPDLQVENLNSMLKEIDSDKEIVPVEDEENMVDEDDTFTKIEDFNINNKKENEEL